RFGRRPPSLLPMTKAGDTMIPALFRRWTSLAMEHASRYWRFCLFPRRGTSILLTPITFSSRKSLESWGVRPLSHRNRDNIPNPIQFGSDSYEPVNGPAIGDLMTMFDFSK